MILQCTQLMPYLPHTRVVHTWNVQVYLMGGMDGNGTILTSTVAYDSIIDFDNQTLADMPMPRTTFTAAALGNRIHVIGGFNSTSTASSHLPEACSQIFDTQANSWAQGPCLKQVWKNPPHWRCYVDVTSLALISEYDA